MAEGDLRWYILFANYEQGLALHGLLSDAGIKNRIAPAPRAIQGELSCGAARLSLEKGESVFIPAGAGEWKLQGRLECIQTGV